MFILTEMFSYNKIAQIEKAAILEKMGRYVVGSDYLWSTISNTHYKRVNLCPWKLPKLESLR